MPEEIRIAEVLDALTLEEKASLLSGRGLWETAGIERLEIPSVTLTDGPHGVRMQADAQHFSLDASLPATCFPTASALGSSWDVGLLTRVGKALGAESRAVGVAVLLGPGINIKRSPLCGRNFEYLSEDPVLSGQLGAALVRGIQSRGVGASVKHFAANNQETDRMRVSAEVDERTLREIYLAGFEHVVTTAKPWTVMAAYNKINGVHAAQNGWLLTKVLREEWGFDGLVVSDWAAVSDPVAAVAAGLDLEMPGTSGGSAARLVEAVKAGRIEETVLDRAVARLLRLLDLAAGAPGPAWDVGFERHHALARLAAAESAVLLKNEDAILPLDPAARITVAVIGEFARVPKFQGAGSSQINPTRVDNALDGLREAAGEYVRMSFSPGFTLSGEEDQALLSEAVSAAEVADVAVVFLGLPEGTESEGYDREHIDLPDVQLRLLRAVAQVNRNVVVVLANGGVVRVATWEPHARAILEGWLNGQAGGGAIADLLFGKANPCGRLAETIPLRLQDTPSYLNFPGDGDAVTYGERLYVGYRYYDVKDMPVSYPFGHGLSYTTFAYSDLHTAVDGEGEETVVRLQLTLTNTGPVTGKEVVQVYVGDVVSSVDRPIRELKAFSKVELAAGQSTRIHFELRARDLSFFSPVHRRWVMESGDFEISIGGSSRDLPLTATVTVHAPALTRPLTLESPVGEWLAHPAGGPLLLQALGGMQGSAFATDSVLSMVESLPLDRLIAMSGGRLDTAGIDQFLGSGTASREVSMTYAFDSGVLRAMTALAASASREPLGPAARDDWKALRAIGAAASPLFSARLPEYAQVSRADYSATSHDGVSVTLRWYAPERHDSAQAGPAAVFLHGGGMIMGSVEQGDRLIAAYAAQSGVPVLAVDYRLAPEHPHPCPVEDCYAGLAWLAAHAGGLGVDAGRIALMGESAGGGLAAGTALLARERGPAVARQILIQPMLDDRNTVPDPALAPFALWSHDDNYTGWHALLGERIGTGAVPASAAPARARALAGLPATYMEVGGLDIFRDEDIEYARRLAAAGVSVELHVHPGCPHGFDLIAPDADVARRARADRLRAMTGY
jgi:beta-glucosidase